MKAGDLVGMMFLARDMTHSVHLNTRSYAKHMALGSFYDNIIEHADIFAEAYQGKYGLIGPIPRKSSVKSVGIVDFLQSQVDDIEKSRYDVCSEKDTTLQQLIDNIVQEYLTTLYKLKFLS